MANNCYNTFTFFGNKKVAQQIDAWTLRLKEMSEGKSGLQSGNVIFEVFFPDTDVQSAISFLGTKWAYPDFGESIPLESGELGFISAWSAMDGFQDHLTQVLSKLDKNVIVLLSSSTEANEESARYTAIGLDGEICSQSAHFEVGDDEDKDKKNPDYTLYCEHQIDACSDLIDAVPGTAPKLKSHLKELEAAFDRCLKQKVASTQVKTSRK